MNDRLPANVIRCYCDGELAPIEQAQAERVLEHCAASREGVAFERTLRQRVTATMNLAAPPGLEAAVRTALMQDLDLPAAERAADSTSLRAAALTRRWSNLFAGPTHANLFAVAACLFLVAGAVLIGIFGQPIDKYQPARNQDVARDAAVYVSGEHGRCAGSHEARDDKFRENTPAAAERALSEFLRSPMHVADLTGIGYEFIGAGVCHVPGFERSAHLFYHRVRADGRTTGLSLFVGESTGPFLLQDGPAVQEMQPNVVYPFPRASSCREGRIWTDGSTINLLVCCNPGDLPKALQLLKPEAVGIGP